MLLKVKTRRDKSALFQLNKKMTFLVNVEGTNLVIAECIASGCRRLVFTSTVGVVFGNQEVYNLSEDAPYVEKVSITVTFRIHLVV